MGKMVLGLCKLKALYMGEMMVWEYIYPPVIGLIPFPFA